MWQLLHNRIPVTEGWEKNRRLFGGFIFIAIMIFTLYYNNKVISGGKMKKKIYNDFELFEKLSDEFVEYMEYFILTGDKVYFPAKKLTKGEFIQLNQILESYHIQLIHSRKVPRTMEFRANFKKSERGAYYGFFIQTFNHKYI